MPEWLTTISPDKRPSVRFCCRLGHGIPGRWPTSGEESRGWNWRLATTSHHVISPSFMRAQIRWFGNSELTLQELLLPALKHFLVRVIPVKQLEDPSDDPARDNLRVGSQL
jgi:hypothetical protein